MSEISVMTFLGLAGILGLALQHKVKEQKKLKKQPIPVRVDEESKK